MPPTKPGAILIILIMPGADGAAPSMRAKTRCFVTGGMRAVASGGVRRTLLSNKELRRSSQVTVFTSNSAVLL